MNLPRPCLYLITDRRRLAPDARTLKDGLTALERWLDDATELVDVIQIREPGLGAGVLAGLVERVASRARGSGTMVVVNDRADVALAAGADGVHLKAGGPPASRVRPLAPGGWTVGRSAHTLDETRGEPAATYLIFGTVFATASKAADTPLQGVEGLAVAAAATASPVLAIGGVSPSRARSCLLAGAAGVAAIGRFYHRMPAGWASRLQPPRSERL